MSSRVAVAVALLLASIACVAALRAPRCEVRDLPMAWADGTLTIWTVTVCDGGPVTVRSR